MADCIGCGVEVTFAKDPLTNRWRAFNASDSRPHDCPNRSKLKRIKQERAKHYPRKKKRRRQKTH